MSKVAISGGATGSATYTIQAPTGSTDRVLTLPDEAGTVLTSGTPLSSFPSGFANGITEADMWRLTTDFVTASGIESLTANFERVDEPSFAKIGTGVSESSGIWAFPTTGLYLVHMSGYFTGSTELTYVGLQLDVSLDNGSTFNLASYNFQSHTGPAGAKYSGTINVESFVNVTNTSNVKVRFSTYTSGGANLTGSTNTNTTWFKFIRLGDAQ